MLGVRLADLEFAPRVNPVTGQGYETARILRDPETGMEVIYVRYPPGSVTPWHTHPCAHGLLVIDGVLQTQSVQFGPGDFVWYPPNTPGEHGATADYPLTVMLVSNTPFSVEYLSSR